MDNANKLNELMRKLPQVDAVLMQPALTDTLETYRRDVVTRLVRKHLDNLRRKLGAGRITDVPDTSCIAEDVAAELATLSKPLLKPVVNATGIILHTNLGRALLCKPAQQAIAAVGGAYCNLEHDLYLGERTRRDVTLEPLFKTLTGCEGVTVVNNNAAAVYLILSTLAKGREVITSRGELVEIGGSYRVPDVVHASGCKLVEVGTTNRTRIADYERAITEDTALLLKSHPSNYRITGFTEEASIEELVELGKKHNIPVYHDLGSGYFKPDHGEALEEEEIMEQLSTGLDLLSFSGDKLFSGPQAGIILGKQEMVLKLRKSALWRVLRIDKFTVAALGATVVEHMKTRRDRPELSTFNHAAHGIKDQARLAANLAAKLHKAVPKWKFTVADGIGYYGGGSMPQEHIPAKLVVVESPGITADDLHARLRRSDPPVVGYSLEGNLALNVMSLLPGDIEKIVGRFSEFTNE